MEQSQPTTATTTTTTTTATTTTTTTAWQVGQLVQVQARTWPGINQPGGVGRITGRNTDGTRVSVRYVLDGRHEKEIETIYLQDYGNSDDASRLRDRSILLGRCHHCGSLRSDCGSCDMRQQGWDRRRTQTQTRGHTRRNSVTKKSVESESDSNSSSDEDSVDQMVQNVRKFESQSRKLKRVWQRYRRFIDDDDDECDSDQDEYVESKSTVTPDADVQDIGSQDLSQRVEEKSVSDADDDSSSINSEEDSKLLEALARTRQCRLSMTRQMKAPQTPSKETNTANRLPSQSLSSPLESSELESQLVADSTDDPFIQPEGSADTLPADVRDASSHIPYTELPDFIDSLIQHMESTGLPAARRKVVQWERQGRRALHDLSATDLQETHDEWVRLMVRGGIDQCQAALRKIASQYRSHKAEISKNRRQEFRGAGMELRETRVDNLSRDVEEVMVRLRRLLRQVKGDNEDEEENDGLSVDDDDGWADPSEESPIRRSDRSPTGSRDAAMNLDDSFDPHEYASRGRKVAATRMSRIIPNRRRKHKSYPVISNASDRPQSSESHKAEVLDEKQDDDSSLQSSVDRDEVVAAESGRKRAISDPFHEQKDESENHRPKRSRRGKEKIPVDFFDKPEKVDRRTGPDQEPALKRMERFLRANGEDVAGELPPSSPESIRRQQPRMRQSSLYERGKPGKSVASNQRPQQPPNRNDKSPNVSNLFSISDHYFSLLTEVSAKELSKLDEDQVTDTRPIFGDTTDLKTLCTGIRTEYGSFSYRQALQKLSDLCLSKNYRNASDAHDIFSCLWACLKENAKDTIQFFVALQPRELPHLIKLHVAFLDAMKGLKETNSHRIEEKMAPVVPSDYVQFVVMQLVESILSLLSPKAWGMTVHNPTRILRHFDSLRRALGNHCNLLDTCSECLMERLRIQQWHFTLDKSNAYISSIDPESWATFLATGKVASDTDTTRLRYADIKAMHLPRCEADALWGLLAFIGFEKSKRNEEAVCVRRLVSALFSRGPLLSSPDQSHLPPSPFQIEACLKELGYVSALLRSESVDSSTMKDSILHNLIKQSVTLGADFVGGVEDARIELFPAFDKASGDWEKLKLLRKRSDLHMSNGVQLITPTQNVNAGDLFSSESNFLGQHEFLPSSDIIRAGLILFVDWYGALPLKRARYASFEKSKNILVKHFKTLANESLKQSTDAFQHAFSTKTPTQSGQGSLRKSSLYIEMAAYLEIMYAVLLNSSHEVPGGVRRVDSLDLLARIRSLLAYTVQDEKSSTDPYYLFICARAISFAGLLCEGIWPMESDWTSFAFTHESSDITVAMMGGDRRNYVLDCLIHWLEQACSSTSVSVEVICFIFQRIAVYLDSTMKADRSRSARSSDVFLVSHLEKLDSLCTRCIRLIISSSCCGCEEDLCLSTALLVADFVAFARAPEPAPTDEWGGLDDSLFTSIVLDADTTKQVPKESLDDLLANALLNSVPSLRYADHANAHCNNVSIQGRLLVARRLKWIVHSLVLRTTVCSHTKNTVNRLSRLWSITFWSNGGESSLDDLLYMRRAGFALIGESCQMWNTPLCHGKMIAIDSTALVLKALELIIDSSSVSRIPSQELSAGVLQDKSYRNEGVAKEFMMYKELQRGGLMSMLRRCDRSWFVCKVIASSTNFVNGRTAIFEAFRQAFEQQTSHTASSEFYASMEKELIRRLNFLLHFLRLVQSRAEFENISISVVGLASTELAKSLYKLKSFEKTPSSHGQAKEAQVLKSYAIFYASIVTQILLQGTSKELLSENVRSLLLDQCLISCLSRRKRATDTMENNISIAASLLNKASPQIQLQLSNVPWDTHDDCIADALRSRSTQIAMLIFDQISEENNTHQIADNLAWALVSSISDSAAASVVARGLLRGCGRTPQGDMRGEGLFPLEIEKLLKAFIPDHLRAKRGNDKDASFVTYVLENVIAKRLRRLYSKCDDRLRLLRLLHAVLKELKIEMIKGWGLVLEPKIIASISNTISISMRSALASNEVDNEVTEMSLLCASCLYGLPSKILSTVDFGWISDWCTAPEELSNFDERGPRKYLNHILTLCTTVCEALEAIPLSSDPGNFLEYRKRLAECTARNWAPFGSIDDDAITSIMFLEKQLVFDVNSTARQLNNVYAIRKGKSGMVEFLPDSKILFAARRFRNEIRRM